MRGRVVAVTGGARGIGLAIATALCRAGARVAIGDLDADLARQQARALDATGPSAAGYPLDVRDEESFANFLAQVGADLGPVDVLVNNAGVVVAGAFLATSAEEHRLQLEVNVGGVERGMRLVLPSMVERGRGHVVNMASAAGLIPAPAAGVYSATKHAVVGLTDAVRFELRRTGVHLTSVQPTFVRTEMAAGLSLRLLPKVAPETVAATVLRVLRRRRPPAAVMVPRWLRPVALADAYAPQWLRDLARVLTPVEGGLDRTARAPYEERLARQLKSPPAAIREE
jgi:NAD(P)-dependent dehydrogenase (short-subunit alcohol dehydrogenase family)